MSLFSSRARTPRPRRPGASSAVAAAADSPSVGGIPVIHPRPDPARRLFTTLCASGRAGWTGRHLHHKGTADRLQDRRQPGQACRAHGTRVGADCNLFIVGPAHTPFFEDGGVPELLPKLLPEGWLGPFMLLVIVWILSGFLDNIAAADQRHGCAWLLQAQGTYRLPCRDCHCGSAGGARQLWSASTITMILDFRRRKPAGRGQKPMSDGGSAGRVRHFRLQNRCEDRAAGEGTSRRHGASASCHSR